MMKGSSNASSSPRRRPSDLSVGIDERSRVSIIQREDYHQAHRDQADEHRNSKDMIRCIAIMRSGSDAERLSDDFCPRGLEGLESAKHLQRAMASKRRVVQAVLDEQERQWEAAEENADRLAQASRRHSSDAVDVAIHRAESDAAFARDYTCED